MGKFEIHAPLAKQLLKEFWLPALVAVAWGIAGYLVASNKPPAWIIFVKDAAACFFLVSWATGQYFRVKKQSKTESDLAGILGQLKTVLANIEQASTHATALSTGGDSYCYVELFNMSSTSNKGLFSVSNHGTYTLFDVIVDVCDTDELQRLAATRSSIGLNAATVQVKLGTVYAGGMSALQYWDLGKGPSPRRYNCFFRARNGAWTQQVRVVKLADRWVTASRVHLPKGGRFDSAYDDYPKNADGTPVWDEDPLNGLDSEGFNLAA